MGFFNLAAPETPIEQHVLPQPVAKDLTELEKLFLKFNYNKDILVISEDYLAKQNDQDKLMVDQLGDRAIKFKNNTLVNVAVIKS